MPPLRTVYGLILDYVQLSFQIVYIDTVRNWFLSPQCRERQSEKKRGMENSKTFQSVTTCLRSRRTQLIRKRPLMVEKGF